MLDPLVLIDDEPERMLILGRDVANEMNPVARERDQWFRCLTLTRLLTRHCPAISPFAFGNFL
jgi:hypothetical protein